jgi:hypothetical protein
LRKDDAALAELRDEASSLQKRLRVLAAAQAQAVSQSSVRNAITAVITSEAAFVEPGWNTR